MPTTYIAEPQLYIDGSPAPENLMEDILQLSVEESLHLPSMFTLAIRNDAAPGTGSEDAIWEHASKFEIGSTIKIGFVSSTTEDEDFSEAETGTVFEGEVTAIETHLTSSAQAPIIVRGYDTSHRLHRGRHNQSFQDITDSDLVKKLAADVGISLGTVDSTSTVHEYVFQENQTHMEFLRERAALNGFELFVQDNKLNFRKPKQDGQIELEWLVELNNFRVRVSSAEQVQQVEVRGWDFERKEAIVSTKNSASVKTSNEFGQGSAVSSAFNGKPSQPSMVVVDRPVFSSKEADTIAQALLDELAGEFIQADAIAEGNPEIRPGQVVKIAKIGKYSGSYYVTETLHLYRDRIYSTEFSVRGLRNRDLVSALSPPQRLQPGQTLLIGKVTNNVDPKKWGRVRVKYPTLTEEHESHWARVVAIGAGANRGFDCLPEVDDEVLLGFEHGDIHRPFVLGGVWNGKDAPSESVDNSVANNKVRLRTFKTRVGHVLQFVDDDKDSKKGVYLDTADGHFLHLNDSDKIIELKTKGGHTVKMDDQSKSIDIQSTGGNLVKLDDAGKKIQIKTSSNSIELADSGGKITIKAAAQMELSAGTKLDLKVGGSTISLTPASIQVSASGVVSVSGATIKLG
ncbi:VgrG-related protein [Synechococcus sp. PCC 7336]|uniref:VgrG-related protein n=1 Tax=Synechococcus sp. PCC 7336 TaxID=195250 RepID=UPI0003462636|nr:VgrG-related protein [Synechococcus sp. PCC 7336]